MVGLINPFPSPKAPAPQRLSLSLGALATFLSDKIPTRIFYDCGNNQELLDFAGKCSVIGFTGMTYQVKRALHSARLIKSRFPQMKIIMGGPAMGLNGETTMLENDFIDCIATGEGEFPLLDFAAGKTPSSSFIRSDGRVVFSNTVNHTDIQKLPIIKRELIPDRGIFFDHALRENAMAVMFSRGCNGSCTFCATPKFMGKPRFRTPEQSVDELLYIVRDFGIRNFAFEDDNFLFSSEFVEQFCSLLLEKNLSDIRFRINCRASDITEKQISLLKKRGLYKISIGVEHTDEKILKLLGKKPEMEKIRKAIEICNEHMVLTALLFMAGAPYETAETLQKVKMEASRLNPSGGFDFQVFQPHPGHPVTEFCKNEGKLLTSDTDDFFSENITYLPAAFSNQAEYLGQMQQITGKKLSSCGYSEPSLERKLRDSGAEIVAVQPDKPVAHSFDLEFTHWQGSERCNTGLSIVKCRKKGFLEYQFRVNHPENIDKITLHGRFASHPEGFPSGEEFSSVLQIFINSEQLHETEVRSVHTTGEYLKIELPVNNIIREVNILRLEIPERKKTNGLSIFYRPLHSFYSSFESPLLLELKRSEHIHDS